MGLVSYDISCRAFCFDYYTNNRVIKMTEDVDECLSPTHDRDWHLNFLIDYLGPFDSRGIDGRLFWQDCGVDYFDGQVNLWPNSEEAWDKAYYISGYCKFNDIPCKFEGGC
tara:strand:- start:955 stop:1287 length:333 start_codon:yes stop_codon:yes gene_type:complete